MRRLLFAGFATVLFLSLVPRGLGTTDAQTTADPTVSALQTRVAEQAATIEALDAEGARSTAGATFAETWRIEVQATRFDPAFVSDDPSTATPEPRFQFLTIIGTITNVSKEPIEADPAVELRLRDAQGRTYAPAGSHEPSQPYLPTYNPDIPTDFIIGFPVPLGADGFRLVSTDGTLDLPVPEPSTPTPTALTDEHPGTDAPAFTLGPPVMVGQLGEVWELDVGDDWFWWRAVDFGWIESPSPRWAAEPHGAWFVVLIDLGTEDSWNLSDFPYGAFALEDDAGNVYFPDLTATSAYCDNYCDMDIDHQSFTNSVSITFEQAIVFDVPLPDDAFLPDDPGITFRTLDGLIAVPLRR